VVDLAGFTAQAAADGAAHEAVLRRLREKVSWW
jgi:hypothetical protein